MGLLARLHDSWNVPDIAPGFGVQWMRGGVTGRLPDGKEVTQTTVREWERLAWVASFALVAACSAGETDNSSFGSFGGPVGGSAPGPADDPNAMDDGDTEDAGSEGDDDDDDDAEGTSGAGSTSGPPDGDDDDDDDDAMGSTDDGAAGSSDGGGGVNPGDQPANGMWAPCVMDDFANCGAADTCVHLGADGFCTVQGCTNPAVDCDPAPAGTSVTPICADAVSTAVCALDCTAGSCPNGMACTTVAINEGPEYNICV